MKKRRHSEISDSEDSDEVPKSQNSSKTVTFVPNNKSSSNDSSDSSSDAEQAPKQTSSHLNRTTPSTSPKKSVGLSPIKKFIEQNPNLTQLRINDVLSEDDEVCFLEIPKTIDPEQLIGRVINFNRRTKIKVNKTRYVIEPNYENLKPFTILTNKLKVVHPVANLQFREYTKRKSDGETVEAEKVTPLLPENLKVRHPLFGDKYESKIVLDEEIQQKLDNTIEEFRKTLKKKKKKKKKHKERAQEEQPEQEEPIFTLLETHDAGKKKKKHREGEKVDVNQESISTSFGWEDGKDFRKKHKKKKKAEDSSFEEVEEKQVDTVETSQERDSFKKKHKKKKQTEVEEISLKGHETFNHVDTRQSSPSRSRDSFKKKHKKKQSEDQGGKFESRDKGSAPINSTIVPGLQLPSFDFDISSIMNRDERDKTNCDDEFDDPSYTGKQKQESSGDGDSFRKKKKKKKDKSEDQDGISPKKKHKRDKEEANNLILDILSRVKNEMEETPITKHKKKKKSER